MVEISSQSSHRDTLVLSVVTSFDAGRRRNFYITSMFQGFTWMLFHFSVVFFFGLLLQNIVLVGVFLGIANLISFLIDLPIGIIQRYVSTKRLMILAGISQLIAVTIFFILIFRLSSLLGSLGNAVTPDDARMFKEAMQWFFGNFMNWIGVFIAAICYGFSQEVNAVSTYGYVLSNTNPSEYSEVFAKNNIMSGIGSILGLLVSGGLLTLNPGGAVVILGGVILGFIAFTVHFFNTSKEVITLDDITAFKASMKQLNNENVKEYVVSIIKKVDLGSVLQVAKKYVFLKPQQKHINTSIPWKTIIPSSFREMKIITEILKRKPFPLSLIWSMALVLIFGFWDTFATSFLVPFLDSVKSGWSYLLLGIIVVPGVALQPYVGKIAERIGIYPVGLFGLILSSVSLILLGVFSFFSLSVFPILFLALLNSVGYACGMTIGQNSFLEQYNILYAEGNGLKEVDANASAGPIRMVGNFANVIGLMLGGLILQMVHHTGFFIFFGLIIGIVAFMTLVQKKNITE